jgi:proprotein convertase subtilisin/kexin type 5
VYIGVQRYLKDSTCVTSCGAKYFQHSATYTCKKCPAECSTCVSQTECTQCIDGHYLLFHPIQPYETFSIGTCVAECAIGYFNYNPLNSANKFAYCEFCAFNCLTCFGPSEDQCLTCYGSFKMDHNSRCVENCPLNKFEDDYGHCDWCHESCLECTGPA